MFLQIAIGSGLLLLTALVSGICFFAMETVLLRYHGWLRRKPHRPKLFVALSFTMLWSLMPVTLSVWIWAFAFLGLGVFEALEPSVYFAIVAFTTLGFGDVLLPVEWRLLGGMAATNGLLNIGLITALLVEALRSVRMRQREAAEEAK